jgi:hypothetical protein
MPYPKEIDVRVGYDLLRGQLEERYINVAPKERKNEQGEYISAVNPHSAVCVTEDARLYGDDEKDEQKQEKQ